MREKERGERERREREEREREREERERRERERERRERGERERKGEKTIIINLRIDKYILVYILYPLRTFQFFLVI